MSAQREKRFREVRVAYVNPSGRESSRREPRAAALKERLEVMMTAEAVLSRKTLSPKEFCDVLVNEVKSQHARLHHPFYLALYDGKLSLEDLRVWAQEAWGIFAYNVAINTAKLVRCQLSGIHDPQIH